jgi:small subunit ribosomal protein S4
MSRYIKSRTKLSRRVGRNLFLKGARSFSPKDDYTKRPFKPTKTRRPSQPSGYGKQLIEKQTLRYTYGLVEKQLGNLFKKAFKKTGETGLVVLSLLERRLDNVVYRSGLANSRMQARQLVNHGHFLVNGKKASIPSFIVVSGDVITLRPSKESKNFWKNFQLDVPNDVPNWLDASKKHLIKVVNEPLLEDLPSDVNMSYVVEYYSRKVA